MLALFIMMVLTGSYCLEAEALLKSQGMDPQYGLEHGQNMLTLRGP